MFLSLSRLFPLFVFPLGFARVMLIATLRLWRRRRWALLGVIVDLRVLWTSGNRIVSMALAQSLEWRYPPLTAQTEAGAIIVLGGATRPQSYPLPINEMNEAGDRMLYALHLYQQGVASKLLLSGEGAACGNSYFYLTPSLQILLNNPIPSASDFGVTTSVIREYIGFVIYRMKGWL